MVLANTIVFFKNLAQYDYENKYYDFHNDYECSNIHFSKRILSLTFENIVGNKPHIYLKFFDVQIVLINFYNIENVNSLTIDNIYRGRFEHNGKLLEILDNKAYFYLEFYEGQRLEFWAKTVSLEIQS